MKIIKRNLTVLTLSIIMTGTAFSQVKIGDNHETINANSLLELESTDKGLLFPRVALTATNNVAPLAAHVQGMTVYNTATVGSGGTAVSPGLYYNTGSGWEKINASSSTLSGAPIGSIITMGSSAVPTGYLYCDGSAISRTTYADLFASIGTAYGTGDGSTTFNLPDYRGYFLRGQDDGRALDPDAAARTGGDAVGSTQTDQVESHTHDTYYSAAAGGTSNPAYRMKYTNADATQSGGVIRSQSTGGNETRPVNISVRYCIKFQETEYTGAAGPAGSAGANGADGNGILNGTVDPTSEGVDGDFYINTATNYIFGPKASGTWSTGTSLAGTDANPVGTILTKMSTNAPTGYLYCNGQSVSTTTYAALFADIGYTYGGSGGTFNLPDLRGEFLRGQDDSRGLDPDAGSRTGGDAVGSTQTDNVGEFDGRYSWTNQAIGTPSGGQGNVFSWINSHTTAGNPTPGWFIHQTQNTGEETHPTNIAVRYYIKF